MMAIKGRAINEDFILGGSERLIGHCLGDSLAWKFIIVALSSLCHDIGEIGCEFSK